MGQQNDTTNAHRIDTPGQNRQHDTTIVDNKNVFVEPGNGLGDGVTREEAVRALLKEQACAAGSSMRDTVTGNLGDVKDVLDHKSIDPYLLRLLSAEDASKISKGSANKSKQSASTDFKVPEPPASKKCKVSDSKGAAVGVQASNSLDKPKQDEKQWDFMDTQNVLGEDTTDILRRSVIQNQREFVEQIYDLHRALAVQKLLVRHSNDQKLLIQEYRKEEGRARRAQKKAGLGFGTTSFNKGLHPDSQFAAVSRDSGTDEDVSGDDLPGSGDEMAASGSGGNGKSGNGSGGGSTSHLNAAAGTSPGLQKGNGMQAPSGASNAPLLSWPPGLVGAMSANGGQQGWNQGMGPALIEMPNAGLLYGQSYGADPMMMWYQDYFNRLAGGGPDPRTERGQAVPAAFKWWRDPKLAFGLPADAKEVMKFQRREGGEVESAPPLANMPEMDPACKATGKDAKRKEISNRLVSPAPKKRPRRRKRLPEDPVDEASSGTSGPAHHLDSSDGGVARSPRSRDANVAKLLLSFSGKSLDPEQKKDSKSRGKN